MQSSQTTSFPYPDQGFINVRAGLARTDLYSDIDVITNIIVRCRVPQSFKLYQMQSLPSLSIPQFLLRELLVRFDRLNRILAEIGPVDI